MIWYPLPIIALSPYCTAKSMEQHIGIEYGIGDYLLNSVFKSLAHFTAEVINDLFALHVSH
jgi:hypothetical protein